ncbi:MAG: FtsW/RodA/SpoVE family cell cycle protein [Faecalibacterium prausnitzii]|nr:FtsW/RodA/SpoVE family cell cycle protein [Faecalibacterium prausnitzii]
MATIRKKHKGPLSWYQKDPGPWSHLLINWLATLAVIMVFGLVMLFSASYTTGYLRMGSSFHYISRQLLYAAAGLVLMVAMSHVDHRALRRLAGPGYWVVLALLAVTLTMAPLNGCRRWLRFGGFTIQTSEVAKFEMILLCSGIAAKAQQFERLDSDRLLIKPTFRQWLKVRVWQQLVKPVAPLVPVLGLLALEPHMSGIVLTVAIVGTILLLTGSGGILTWVGAITAGGLLETVLSHVDSIPYLQDRLEDWSQDLDKVSDQTLQSLYAIGSGGLKGLGLGNSVEKQLWLPESTNDFIFSVVCEELGFIGATLIILLFVLFIVQGLLIAYRAENLYCTMVGIGIMAQIAWQMFCNIAVVTNTLPNTGISLPFFSSGGSSLMLLLAEMGVMVNIGRNGQRAAQQRQAARAQREAERTARQAKNIVLADVRAQRSSRH